MLDSVKKEDFREWIQNPLTKALLDALVIRRLELLEQLAVTLDARDAGRILELAETIRMVGEYE